MALNLTALDCPEIYQVRSARTEIALLYQNGRLGYHVITKPAILSMQNVLSASLGRPVDSNLESFHALY